LVHLGGTAVDANIAEGYANVATGRLSGTGIRNAKPGAARREALQNSRRRGLLIG